MRGEWFGVCGAEKLCLERAEMCGHGRKMQRSKTAIGNLDRVAFCPPAGHLTSSYWAAVASGEGWQPSGPMGPKFFTKRRICRF
jgi:hypothetical protein